MSITRVIAEEDQHVLDLLRAYGLEERAREYEALLRGELPFRIEPDPLPEPVLGAVPVAEAAARLGLSHKEIRGDIEAGLLKTEANPATGELLVTNDSISKLLDWQRRLAVISRPLPGDSDESPDPNSLLGRLFAEDNELWEDDEEA